MNNIEEISNSLCVGCGVCYITCNKSAINIDKNKYGFYEARVNGNCIECGKCKKVCYKFITEEEGNYIEDSNRYLSYSNDENVRYRGSSGGLGEEICNFAIKEGYKVCGVEYDCKKNIAKHVILNKEEEIKNIIGSKYIPSYTIGSFNKLKKIKKYLIIGTPCQIYGLRKYMEVNKIDNWILIDFFCHGSASLNLWGKYLDMIKIKHNIKDINYVNFRDKANGWHNFRMTISDGENQYCSILHKDEFMECFLGNIDLQESCYNCKLRYNKIYSDIRLGDFWGPKCKNDEKGSSIILVNTDVGKYIWDGLENVYKEEISLNEMRESQMINKLEIPREKTKFQKELISNEDLDKIYKKITTKNKRKENVMKIIKIPKRCLDKLMIIPRKYIK